uniref:Uncharacterized protein n=1 Tax=Schistosoma curassoni TaxID=6186 RepID=A0A183KHY7_9TREM
MNKINLKKKRNHNLTSNKSRHLCINASICANILFFCISHGFIELCICINRNLLISLYCSQQ